MATALPTPLQQGIQTRDLNLWYGTFQALKNISLDIKPGLVTALIGPSGCGKTTLLRCLNRINERYGNVTTTGRITVLGKNIYDPDVSLSELRKSVGMVFQRPNPLPISIRENLLFGVRVHVRQGTYSRGEEDVMVESALRDVQLWDEVKDRLKKRATLLSLEQQQKLCIARLLPLKPRVILMDEPCSALDAAGIEQIETLIHQLRKQLHDFHRDPQHAPGREGQRRVHFHAAGPHHRTRQDGQHLPQPEGKRDRDVRYRPLRITTNKRNPCRSTCNEKSTNSKETCC